MIKRVILLLSILSTLNCLSYDMAGKKEMCVKYGLHAGKNLKVTYMFTGQNEQNVEFKVSTHSSNVRSKTQLGM